MIPYIVRRLLQAVPTVFLASVGIFLVIHLVPGDPALVLAGPDPTPEVVAAIRQKLGLNEPLPVQYVIWGGRVLRGDLGTSYSSQFEVWDLVKMKAPATFELTAAGLLLTVLVAVPLGVLAAVKQHTRTDLAVSVYASVGLGVPNFWLGILLILLFALALGWLPPGGRVDPLRDAAGGLQSLLLPGVTLAVAESAALTRFVKASVLEVLHEDYIRTARAKGLRGRNVLVGHALRNALIPVITVVGIEVGRLLGGAVIVESVFAWPGLGRMMLQAISERDYPLVQGGLLLLVTVFILVNLVTDIGYAFLDPRIRLGGGAIRRG